MEAYAPIYLGFNFLTTSSLIRWGGHINKNTPPFAYNMTRPSIWADPMMQFMGKVDLALQGGSEEIFVPDSRGWAPHANVRSEEHTSELQSRPQLVCRLL